MSNRFERALLAALEHGEREERFVIPEHAHRGLLRALDADLRSAKSAAVLSALDAALRLAAAFDGSMRSPSIAELIRTLLRDDPRAVAALVARRQGTSPIDALREHARREDRAQPALPIPAPAPSGTRPLRAWINTGNTQPRGRRSWQQKA